MTDYSDGFSKKELNFSGDNLHEITINDYEEFEEDSLNESEDHFTFDSLHNNGRGMNESEESKEQDGSFEFHKIPEPFGEFIKQEDPVSCNVKSQEIRKRPVAIPKKQPDPHDAFVADSIKTEKKSNKKYVFPPLNLLKKGELKGTGDSAKQLKETALRLQQTSSNFGVKVTITNIRDRKSVV